MAKKKNAGTNAEPPKMAFPTEPPAPSTVDYSSMVTAFVERRSAFGVRGKGVVMVNYDLELTRKRRTYYAVERTHTMPALHAEILSAAGLITSGSINRAAPGARPTGLVRRPDQPRPKIAEFGTVDTKAFANAQDVRSIIGAPITKDFSDPDAGIEDGDENDAEFESDEDNEEM